MKALKTYIFDLDGTLVNSLDSIAYFANKALNKYNLPSIPTERYKHLVGNGASVLVKRMLAEVGANEDMFDKVSTEYNTTYDNDFLYLTRPYDGILDLLEELKKRGCKTAIVSNKPHSTTKKISDSLFGSLIDICFGKREGHPVKPDPASVNEIIEKLGADKGSCVYTGDTIVDMQTGKNAGLYTVGVLWGFRDIDEIKSGQPQMIVSDPMDILDTIEL